MSKSKAEKAADAAQKQESIEKLRSLLKPGDTIHTILRHVSKSGMQREISLVCVKDGDTVRLDWHTAHILGLKLAKGDGVVIGGAGMDMGFQLVYLLGGALFPEGFKVTKPCDACKGSGISIPDAELEVPYGCLECKGTGEVPASGRNGDKSGWDKNGGYALKQRWL